MQAAITTPTLFRRALNVAGVGDWETGNPGQYTIGRMGNAVTNPDEFDRSASVRHLDKLTRPMLILQGTNDTNVPLWETLKVIDT